MTLRAHTTAARGCGCREAAAAGLVDGRLVRRVGVLRLRQESRFEQFRSDCLKAATHGTVRQAAFDAASLYVHGRQPRTIKQCIGYAASINEVTWTAVSAYLHGIAFNALFADGGVFADIAAEADQSKAFTLDDDVPIAPSADYDWNAIIAVALEATE